MYCKICGDDKDLTKVLRFWSPDDGWLAGRLCRTCYKSEGKRKPELEDFAYDKRGDVFTSIDDAIDAIFG